MARAYASDVIDAPIETVWTIVRDFNGLPDWAAGIGPSHIEDGRRSDTVGCVRAFTLGDGTLVRERLLALDDLHHSMTYNFETPAFPVENYIATLRLLPVTARNATFAEWEATFDEAPGDAGKYERIISTDVFAANWSSLRRRLASR